MYAVLNLIWWRRTYSLPSICEYFCGHCFCTITQLGTTVSFCSTYVNNNNSESLLLLLDRYRLKNNVWDCWGDRYIRHRQTNAKDALESTKCDNIKHVLTEFFYSFQGLICFFFVQGENFCFVTNLKLGLFVSILAYDLKPCFFTSNNCRIKLMFCKIY